MDKGLLRYTCINKFAIDMQLRNKRKNYNLKTLKHEEFWPGITGASL